MKYQLIINGHPTDGHFADLEQLKAYLIKWNYVNKDKFEVMEKGDENYTVVGIDDFVNMLLKGDEVECHSEEMCEMGDDFVDVRLIVS